MTLDVGNLTGKRRLAAITKGQKRIIKESLKHISERVLKCIDKLPEDWDGFELRWLIAKAAENNSYNPDKKRKREFENTCNVRNLP